MDDQTIQESLIKILEQLDALANTDAKNSTFWVEWEDAFVFIDKISGIDENGVI